MIEVAILSWVNHVDGQGATISASNEGVVEGLGALSFPALNLKNTVVGRHWRTGDLAAHVDIDFGSDKAVELLMLRHPRTNPFPTAGTVRHQLDADGGTPGAGAAYDNVATIDTADGYGYHVHRPPASIIARYWRFAFDVAGIAVLDVGRAWAGEIYQPARNISFGYSDEWSDFSNVTVSSRSGVQFADERSRQRQFAFAFDSLEPGDRDEIREMSRIVGVSRQVVFVKDPAAPSRETILGRMGKTTPLVHRDLPIHSKAFVIRESL